jgi:hypothetical protein
MSELTSGEDLTKVLDSQADQVMEDSEGKDSFFVMKFTVQNLGTVHLDHNRAHIESYRYINIRLKL